MTNNPVPKHSDECGETYIFSSEEIRTEILNKFNDKAEKIKFLTKPEEYIDGKYVLPRTYKTHVPSSDNVFDVIFQVVEEALNCYEGVIYFYTLTTFNDGSNAAIRLAKFEECMDYDTSARHSIEEDPEWLEVQNSIIQDDAPELDENWAKNAYHYDGDTLLKPGKGVDPMNGK